MRHYFPACCPGRIAQLLALPGILTVLWAVPLASCAASLPTQNVSLQQHVAATQTSPVQTTEYDLPARLETWKRLTAQQDPHLPAQAYADFLENPQIWPLYRRIIGRFQTALSTETDPENLKKFCPRYMLTQFSALLACQNFLARPEETASRLWRQNLVSDNDEAAFLAHYGQALTANDEWARYTVFERLRQKDAAQKQIRRLAPAQQAVAQARLAARFYDEAPFYALSPAQKQDDQLLFLVLRSLRHNEKYEEALTFQKTYEPKLSHISDDWMSERMALARGLLARSGNL